MNQIAQRDAVLGDVAWQRRWRALIALGKPGVTALLVFTAVTTAWAASGPWLSLTPLVLLALAGGLTAAGSAALNQYLERDLDARMPRTARRPLPSGLLPSPQLALGWGVLLCVAGITLAALTLPPEATTFIVLGLIVYIPVYTILLKRRTVWAVVIGGAAGSCPVLAGWAVVRADWPITPFALAALVFFWTPAHFWAYAMVHKEGYGRAGFPMLPNLIGLKATPPYMLAHTAPTVLASVLALSGLAAVIAGGAGLALLALNLVLWRAPTPRWAWRFYKASNYYLVLVFLALVIGG
jgi:protoheme IX farnesyltransferase